MFNSEFSYALLGGALIGLAAAGMLWANGRILGVSGILNGLFLKGSNGYLWRALFVSGMIVGGFLIPKMGFTVMEIEFDRTQIAALIGGVLVGIGTTIGNGCTSGHAVCGLSRFSPRSFVATLVFMFFGFLSVGLIRGLLGGGL